jgi:hypothetical protein
MSVLKYVRSVNDSMCRRTHMFRKDVNVATKLDGLLNLVQSDFSVLLIKITGVCCSRLDDVLQCTTTITSNISSHSPPLIILSYHIQLHITSVVITAT